MVILYDFFNIYMLKLSKPIKQMEILHKNILTIGEYYSIIKLLSEHIRAGERNSMIPRFDSDESAEKYFKEHEEPELGDSESDEPDEVTIIELEGERYEIVDVVQYNGKDYVAVTPFDDVPDYDNDENGEFTILEVSDDPDDEDSCVLKTVDDEELYTLIGDLFLERFADIEDE